MWIPKTEQEITCAVESGSLEETAIFDGKQELPPKSKNVEVAKDVAAMAIDGGVLIYGIGEDDQGHLTKLNPVQLAGAPERINNIVQTSISEPPTIFVNQIPKEDDPSRGYIVVVVPQSERAPHMVVAGKEHRFYGRGDKGNRPLTEGEVARLYERRRQWEVDVGAFLDKEIQDSPFPPSADSAYLFVFARPVACRQSFLEGSVGSHQDITGLLRALVDRVSNSTNFRSDVEPHFRPTSQWEIKADGYLGKIAYSNPEKPREALYLRIGHDGSGHLFCGRAAEKYRHQFTLYGDLVAGNTVKFLELMGDFYDSTAYVGTVDVGVALTGVRGTILDAKGLVAGMWARESPYDGDDYKQTSRRHALELKEAPQAVANSLLKRFFDAMSQGRIDLFGTSR